MPGRGFCHNGRAAMSQADYPIMVGAPHLDSEMWEIEASLWKDERAGDLPVPDFGMVWGTGRRVDIDSAGRRVEDKGRASSPKPE